MGNAAVERCFVINLDRRPDRMQQFLDGLPKSWPLPQVERISAFDGQGVNVLPPLWPSKGAWGCYQSHLSILNRCLDDGVNSYAVFEDDAIFSADFKDRFVTFMRELPENCGLAYLGGQNLMGDRFLPIQISESVFVPYNVNRTHAMILRGRESMMKLQQHLCRPYKKPGFHIDHLLGQLIQRQYHAHRFGRAEDARSVPTYIPSQWMVGQNAGHSDIVNREIKQTKLFLNAGDVSLSTHPFVAVMGIYRSGTTAVSLMLRDLGVYMGNKLVGRVPDGGGEAIGLRNICENVIALPDLSPKQSERRTDRLVKRWVIDRKNVARNRPVETIAGGKHPLLCAMGPHLLRAAGQGLVVISIDRSIEEATESLQQCCTHNYAGWSPVTEKNCRLLQERLMRAKQTFLDLHPSIPVLRVDYNLLQQSPAIEVDRVIAFLKLSPSRIRRRQAVRNLEKQSRHFGAATTY
ncbi:glycosyltransferase family 25 protein [Rubripirellula lacrimiformis]